MTPIKIPDSTWMWIDAQDTKQKKILCVPVFNRAEKCIGTIEALNRRTGNFVDEDAEFLKSISDYVAIAVENSRLYEDIKTYTERLEATILIAEKLEKIKAQLTKFVPASVAKIMEQEPDKIMGINSGKAYVGTTRMMSVTGERLAYTASGLVTVIAARIGKLSENTSLFIGPETYSMIRDIYPCDFIGDCRLKNISELTSIFQVKFLH